MSTRQIRVCDRCQKTAETNEEVSALAVSSISVGRRIHYSSYQDSEVYPASEEWSGEWCAACCREVGVFEILALEQKPPEGQPVPTLEDMIRELVRQEMP